MKKLPDLKQGNMEAKNITFSSDSEDPNIVSFDVLDSVILREVSYL